jgi:transposase-like protein
MKKQAQVIAALVEGNSIRSTVRMTGVAKNTIVKLLADVGKACAEYQDKTLSHSGTLMTNVTCPRFSFP